MEIVSLKDYEDFDKYRDEPLTGKTKGEILLPIPIINPLEWSGEKTNPYAVILGISQEDFECIVYYAKYVIKDKKGKILVLNQADYIKAGGDILNCMKDTGGEAIIRLLEGVTREHLKELYEESRERETKLMADLVAYEEAHKDDEIIVCGIDEKIEFTEDALAYRRNRTELEDVRYTMDSVSRFLRYGTSRLVMRKIKVFPLELCTIIRKYYETNPMAVAYDLSTLYSRVIGCSNSCRKMLKGNVPALVKNSYACMLQRNVDALLCNGRTGIIERTALEDESRPLISILDVIGKTVTLY